MHGYTTRAVTGPSGQGAIPDVSGMAITVRGPVDPGQLGVTLTHEHIFIDLRRTHLPHRKWVVDDDRLVAEVPDEDFPATELARWEAKLDLSIIMGTGFYQLKRDPWRWRDST